MGKILIIRGASYTPPSGSGSSGSETPGTPVIPDIPDTPVTPDPPAQGKPYQVFYSSNDADWTMQRPQSVTSVALVIQNRITADVDGFTYTDGTPPCNILYCRRKNPIEITDGAFHAPYTEYSPMGVLSPGTYEFESGERMIVLWFFNLGEALSSSQVEKCLKIAEENFTWITG